MNITTRVAATIALALAQTALPYAQRPETSARAELAPPGGRTPVVLPGTPAAAFTTIRGTALDANDGPLPDMPVRLRNGRTGRLVDSQLTDKAGLFTFREVDPGSYVVELIGSDLKVLAASRMLSLDAGEAASVVVQLPFNPSRLNGILGRGLGSALAITASAAAAGVLTATSTTDVSGETPPVR